MLYSNPNSRKVLTDACEEVFGASHSWTSEPNNLEKPPITSLDDLNLYFATIQCTTAPYRVFFLPEPWINPMGITWHDCKWRTGFFNQPMIADFFFSEKKDKVTLYGQLITQPGSDRRRLVKHIEEVAKRHKLEDRIRFGPRSHPDSQQSAFFRGNIYKLYGKHDAKSLAKVMKEAIDDFTPAINAIGESLGD